MRQTDHAGVRHSGLKGTAQCERLLCEAGRIIWPFQRLRQRRVGQIDSHAGDPGARRLRVVNGAESLEGVPRLLGMASGQRNMGAEHLSVQSLRRAFHKRVSDGLL